MWVRLSILKLIKFKNVVLECKYSVSKWGTLQKGEFFLPILVETQYYCPKFNAYQRRRREKWK